MRKILTLTLICLSFVLTDVQAQQNRPRMQQSAQMQNLQKVKTTAMIRFLEIDEKQKDKFTEIYIEYDNAMNDASARAKSINHVNKLDPKTVTEEQMKESVLSQLELSRELIEIKATYFERLNEILNPQQMLGFYQKENDIRQKIQRELKNRTGAGNEPPHPTPAR